MTTMPKEALDAMTDQALAHLRKEQRKRDDLTQAQCTVAEDLAALFLTQFPGEHEFTGRVLVTAAQALTSLTVALRDLVPEYNVAPVMTNILGFAGERVAHHEAGER